MMPPGKSHSKSDSYPEGWGQRDQQRQCATLSAVDLHQAAMAVPLSPGDIIGIGNGNRGFAKIHMVLRN